MSQEYRSEIYRLLKIGENPNVQDVIATHSETAEVDFAEAEIDLPVPFMEEEPSGSNPWNIPVLELGKEDEPLADQLINNILTSQQKNKVHPKARPLFEVMEKEKKKSFSAKGLVLYPFVFVVAFAFFYVLLNFSSLVNQVNAWFAKPEDEQILKEDLVAFYSWMEGYYFAVQDRELLEPANDIDKDGLANIDEFKIRTNPTVYDSDLDGASDGVEIINSTNPWGQGPMTGQQQKLREELDIIRINNRISFNVASLGSESIPQNIEYDTTRSGTLSIPKLSMQVPIIWSKDPANFDADLTKGVVHYPGTAMPGDKGTIYISGHSSDYFWKNHPYKQVFSKINALEIGDDIFVDIYGVDGKTYNYRYRVSAENIFRPDDQTQFIDNSTSKLNLSTCWPIGTQKDRYVVSANLVPL
ncbi:MAG TPA: sortase [Verrucomicrobiae bacterium]|nr:sortase [Verrucomicrobiae bacterium]